MEFITTLRGAKTLVYQGHKYVIRGRRDGEKIYWCCARVKTAGCNARLTTKDEQIVTFHDCHNHPPDRGETAGQKTVSKLPSVRQQPMAVSLLEGSYGGKWYQFVHEIPFELICELCTGIVEQPHIAGCCGQYYCKRCLDDTSGKQTPVCPNCLKPNFRHWLDSKAEKEVKSLRVRCLHMKEGCTWSGPIADLEAHDTVCEGSVTICNCQEPVKKQDLVQHLLHSCPLRHCRCKHCGLNGTHRDIEGKHAKECPNLPVVCPNLCQDHALIKQSLLEKHRSHCPLERIDCMYRVVGCAKRMLRIDHGHHLRTNFEHHTSLLLRTVQYSMTAVIAETEFLSTLPSHMENVRKLSMECIKTLTGANSTELKINDHPLTFRLNNYLELKQSEMTWRSPEFSVDGCKMHLVAEVGGTAEGLGTHISLLLEAVRIDAESCWSEGVVGVELKPQCEGTMFVPSFWLINARQIPWQDLGKVEDGVPVRLAACNRFAAHDDLECGMLFSDSLVFQVQRLRVSAPH